MCYVCYIIVSVRYLSGYYGNVCYSNGCYGNLLGTSSNHSVQMRKSPEALSVGNLEMAIFVSLIFKV